MLKCKEIKNIYLLKCRVINGEFLTKHKEIKQASNCAKLALFFLFLEDSTSILGRQLPVGLGDSKLSLVVSKIIWVIRRRFVWRANGICKHTPENSSPLRMPINTGGIG